MKPPGFLTIRSTFFWTMKPKHLIAVAMALLWFSGVAALAQSGVPLTNISSFKPFIGLGYSPFQGSQSPNYGTYPTVDGISYDLTNSVIFLASEIRTFGMS